MCIVTSIFCDEIVNLNRFLQAILDYIVAHNWSNIAVIYEQYTLDIVILQVIYFTLSAIILSTKLTLSTNQTFFWLLVFVNRMIFFVFLFLNKIPGGRTEVSED